MSFIERAIYLLPGLILSLTIHEYAHARTAYHFGDSTAKQMGRLNLNPLSHLDIVGSLMLLFAGFGWAKPVPVNPMNLANPKRDMVLVSLAGPLSNMILAAVIAIIIRGLMISNIPLNQDLVYIIIMTFQINLVLAMFNLIPIQPLDGSKIVLGLLPYNKAIRFEEITRHGPMILMGIMIFGSVFNVSPFSIIIEPWVAFWTRILLG